MLRQLLTRPEKIKCLGILVFALVTSVFEIVTAGVIVVFAQVLNAPTTGQQYLDKIGFSPNLSAGRIVFCIAMIVGGVFILKNIVAAAEVFFQNFTLQKMNYHFITKMLQRYSKADYGFYLTRNSSFGMQVVGGDVEMLFTGGMLSLAGMITESIVFIGLLGTVIFMNPSLALIIFGVGGVIAAAVAKGILPQFYRWGQKFQDAGMYGRQYLLQFFHAFKEIVLLGKRDAFVAAYQVHALKRARVVALQTAASALPRMVLEILFVGLFVFAVAYLCIDHESPVQMIGVLGGYLYAGFRLMPGLNRIIGQLSTLKSAIPAIARVHGEYTNIAGEERYKDLPDFKFEHSLCFKDVYFRYLNTETDALSGVNLDIKKGDCVGIVGETGSGKSTLVDLMLGLLQPSAGSIVVDGAFPVHAYQWHQKIGYVPQVVYLTDDTIAANIAFGEEAIDAIQLNKAIDAAQLRRFMDALPQGAQTIVGERGIRLSGGERQRISIARALYRNPEVLIFDEATSALDNKTEERLMETIHSVSQDRTVIMIAHRVFTLQRCNRIIKIKNSKASLLDSKDFEELMQ